MKLLVVVGPEILRTNDERIEQQEYCLLKIWSVVSATPKVTYSTTQISLDRHYIYPTAEAFSSIWESISANCMYFASLQQGLGISENTSQYWCWELECLEGLEVVSGQCNIVNICIFFRNCLTSANFNTWMFLDLFYCLLHLIDFNLLETFSWCLLVGELNLATDSLDCRRCQVLCYFQLLVVCHKLPGGLQVSPVMILLVDHDLEVLLYAGFHVFCVTVFLLLEFNLQYLLNCKIFILLPQNTKANLGLHLEIIFIINWWSLLRSHPNRPLQPVVFIVALVGNTYYSFEDYLATTCFALNLESSCNPMIQYIDTQVQSGMDVGNGWGSPEVTYFEL